MTAGTAMQVKNSPRRRVPLIITIIISVLYTHIFLMEHAECLNCSQPTMDSLLQALRGNVFGKTEVRPVIDPQKPTNISIDMYIYGILDVDEKGQVLDMFIWLYLYWEIEGLYWDPVECGTDRVSLPRTVLWSPDIVINEFMDENRAPPTYFVYVNNLGEVEDEQSIHVISSCNLDIYTFPFDVQNCTYSIYSYLHRAGDVQLFFRDEMKNVFQNSLSTIGTNGEWELINLIPVKPPKDPDFNPKDYWDSLVIHIILKRKSALYVVNLLLPSCFLAALDVLSFLLPVQHVDRSAFKMTLILGYTVFLLLMNDLLPVTGNNIPLINVFFSVCLALMVVSLMETIVVTNIICNAAKYPPVPGWIRTVFLRFLARLFCMGRKSDSGSTSAGGNDVGDTSSCKNPEKAPAQQEELSSSSEEPVLQELRSISSTLSLVRQQMDDQPSGGSDLEDDWIRIGLVIDRGFFIVYILFIIVSFSTILTLWLHWYTKRNDA